VTCKQAIRQLSEFLDGELPAELAEALQRHLKHCEDCRLVVDTTRKTIEICCNTEPPPLPEGVRERLEHALADKFSSHKEPRL
jgi:anti-sigma factor (TIGR02949 family)